MGVVAHHYPGHLQHVRRAGTHHCIVEVADHTETGSARHVHVSYLYHPSSTRRRWRQELQLDLVPPARTVERLLELESHLEEALRLNSANEFPFRLPRENLFPPRRYDPEQLQVRANVVCTTPVGHLAPTQPGSTYPVVRKLTRRANIRQRPS